MDSTPNTTEDRRLAMMQKVAKLMDKAAGAKEIGNLAEAEAFTLGVQRIMQEYNLTEWEITKNRPEVTSVFKIENTDAERVSYDDFGKKGRPGGLWQFDLWEMLAPNFGCSFVFWKKTKTIALFGTKVNIQAIRYTFSFLDNLLPELALQAWKEQGGSQGQITNRYQYMRSWIDGAVKGLGVKLKAERQAREYANNSEQGLMTFNKAALVKAKEDVYGKLKSSDGSRDKQTSAATVAGYAKGVTLEITKGVEAGPATEKLKALEQGIHTLTENEKRATGKIVPG
jgi:hypothetical protein